MTERLVGQPNPRLLRTRFPPVEVGVFLGILFGGTAGGQTITEFNIPTPATRSHYIAAGPDGNLWFTEYFASKIGRITTAGAITEFSTPTFGFPWRIVTGSDSNLWFTEEGANNIARIT